MGSVEGLAPTDLGELLAAMELDEKISLLSGHNVWETAPIERLGIPSLKMTDGPNGARGGEFFDGTTAACFPACVSLASTFNRSLARRIGKALAEEAQTKSAHVLLGPTVCIHRSPLGGRNFEAFSEDPLLSGSMAIEYVKGLQSERVGATVKHFIANEQETRRFSVDETISERALREIYLRPFEMIIKQADPWCIMSSYNKVGGAHVDAQPTFIRDILRQQWGYQGLVMSDWGAVSNHVESINYGLDIEMPGPAEHRTLTNVRAAVKAGHVSVDEIDNRVMAVLKLLEKTGKFADRKDTGGEQAINRPEHQALIRQAGAEGIVLLKNTNNALPLKPAALKKIALVGPLAKYAAAHGGGSASLNAHYKISPYDALKARLGNTVDITCSKGAHIFRIFPDLQNDTSNRSGEPGFTADFFESDDLSGVAFYSESYPRGFFTTLMNTRVTPRAKSARFSTTYTPTTAGNHYLSFSGIGSGKLFINGTLVSHQLHETPDTMAFFLGVQEEHRFQHAFEAGQSYSIVIETARSEAPNAELRLMQGNVAAHLGLVPQAEMEADLLAEAVAAARDADLAVCFVGNTTQWETEGQDLATMALPADGSQDRLVAAVCAANPNTIVVLTTGVPVAMPWLSDVSAVLQAWYAGQETGNAIADVLLGDVNPSGKLPVSWPRKYEDSPCYGNFGLDSYDSRKVEYVEGTFVGYRHFDRVYGTEKEVLFPFGYGMSYTTFEVGQVTIEGTFASDTAGDTVTVSLVVKNTGDKAGAETLQVYVAPPSVDADTVAIERPPKALATFSKVHLEPAESKTISMSFGRDAAAYWDDRSADSHGQCWRVAAGDYKVVVATSSRPDDAKAASNLQVIQAFCFGP